MPYYRLDSPNVERKTWSFENSTSKLITENDTHYKVELNIIGEAVISGYLGIQNLTQTQFRAYTSDIKDWSDSVVGSRPPKAPK